jgi:DNA-binding NarL/FixJ family response regulator
VASPVRILLVADDAIARAGLRAVAERAGVSVVGDAAPDELDPTLLEAADAVLWDAGASGALDGLREAAARIPVLTLPWSAEQAREALAAGARGVLSRERIEEQLLVSLQAVTLGLLTVDAAFDEAVRPRTPPEALVEPLTPRETEVLQLLAQGFTNRRIGEQLGISEHTAKFHVNAILGKLGAQTRGEAIAHAARLGLLLL